MEKSESKKLIPLYLERLFLEETDETHYIRMPQILFWRQKESMQTAGQSMRRSLF